MSIMGLSGLLQAAVPSDDSVLTFNEVIADIPHDTAAIVVYAMLLFSVGLIWRSNRRPRPKA